MELLSQMIQDLAVQAVQVALAAQVAPAVLLIPPPIILVLSIQDQVVQIQQIPVTKLLLLIMIPTITPLIQILPIKIIQQKKIFTIYLK